MKKTNKNKDTQRLNWLQKTGTGIYVNDDGTFHVSSPTYHDGIYNGSSNSEAYKKLRDAIDENMNKPSLKPLLK